jgi:hypothetical protein
MADYRVYGVDNMNHIVSGQDLQCDTDVGAIKLGTATLRYGGCGEVWQGARLVGKISEPEAGHFWTQGSSTAHR